METLSTLTRRHAQDGRLDWIGLRPERLADIVTPPEVLLRDDGLEGDHSRPGKRALTLIQAEHLPVIAALAGLPSLSPWVLRRNLVISRVNLQALRGKTLRLGGAVVEVTIPCAPCSRMETALGPGGYTAMRGHGGWCARVLEPGLIRLGDIAVPA